MAILITDEEEGRGMLIADEMLITDEEDGRGWPRSVRYIRYCGWLQYGNLFYLNYTEANSRNVDHG